MTQRVIFYARRELCKPKPHDTILDRMTDGIGGTLEDFKAGVINTLYWPVDQTRGYRVDMPTDNFEVLFMADIHDHERIHAANMFRGLHWRERMLDELRVMSTGIANPPRETLTQMYGRISRPIFNYDFGEDTTPHQEEDQ